MWGQCRRHSPHLNPTTAKTYHVEGVWPLIRDDDWCGEWKALAVPAAAPSRFGPRAIDTAATAAMAANGHAAHAHVANGHAESVDKVIGSAAVGD